MSIKKISIFTLSNYIALFCSLAQALIIAKILSTVDMGSFSQIKILLSYLLLLNPGVINGLIYLIPLSEEKRGKEYGSSAFVFSFILFFIVFVILSVVFVKSHNFQWLFMGVILLFTSLREVISFILRGFQKFSRLSALNLISSAIQSVLIITFSYFWKLTGALWGLSASAGVSLIIALFLARNDISLAFSFERVKCLFSSGWMIYLNGLYATVLSSFERLSLSFTSEKNIFAVYSIGIFFISIFDILSSSITQYLTPKMIKEEKSYLENKLQNTTNSIIYIMIAFIFIFLIMIKFTVPVFLNKYTESVRIASILSITSLFQVFYNLMFTKYLSSKSIKKYFPLQTVGSLLTVGGILLYFVYFDSNNLILFSLFVLAIRILYLFFAVIYFNFTSRIKMLNFYSIISLLIGGFLFISTYFSGKIMFTVSLAVFALYFTIFYKKIRIWKKSLI
ncbi:MAG: hypothetical protein COX48_01910 [bacterium (Candidatus Stahlbacteria) CG23_combo_of_CG06-09_8_20_14_all_34_7]|nr:MAG: hypothetical protein COX48_01910 [bacterium (Candidatus Stahlbacteria) CG23_combo_of_CG06-09_8_20_14_all_34_7]